MTDNGEDEASAPIVALLAEIRALYALYAPSLLADGWHRLIPATAAEIEALEALIGAALPADYRAFLRHNDVRHSFSGNVACLEVREVGNEWQRMTELLDAGAFDDGRIAHHIAAGFGNWDDGRVAPVWWSRAWLPFAQDSCGNLHCLDGAPGPRGVRHQVVCVEVQDGQGPFSSEYGSFTAYLAAHLTYLQQGQFTVEAWGIEVDKYMAPRRLPPTYPPTAGTLTEYPATLSENPATALGFSVTAPGFSVII